MILLREHKILFLKPHKVAGTSFEIALLKYAGESDIITRVVGEVDGDGIAQKSPGLQSFQNSEYTKLDLLLFHNLKYLARKAQGRGLRKFVNHTSAKEAKKKLGPQIWGDVQKISIVRNPFDCVVSNYYWKTKNEKDRPEFSKWFHSNLRLTNQNYDQYFIDEKDAIDYYIRFEEFEQDISALEQKVSSLNGLYEIFASINAKGNIRPDRISPSDFFKGHDEIVSIVFEMNQHIIEKFDYSL